MKYLLLGLVLTSIFLLALVNAPLTSTQETTSNVTVNVYISIALSIPLAEGVQFGSLDPGTSNQSSSTCTSLACNVSVSSDTNVNVDIVLKVNAPLTKTATGTQISNVNYLWNSTDGTLQPGLTPDAYVISTTYDYTNKVGSNVAPGFLRTWQAWLSIPTGQEAGNYNNTLSFCGTETGTTNC